MFDLEGRVAIVTGGAGGIGAGIAAVLAEARATVVIADRELLLDGTAAQGDVTNQSLAVDAGFSVT